jgi:hypothetical protein
MSRILRIFLFLVRAAISNEMYRNVKKEVLQGQQFSNMD